METHDKILIVDFGSQVTQLIARRVREEKNPHSWQCFGRAIRPRSVSKAPEDASLTLVFGSDYNSRSCAALGRARRT